MTPTAAPGPARLGPDRAPVRITGLACRLPGADTVDAAFARLRGAPAFRRVDRWGEPAYGAWLDDPCAFDPAPFGLAPYEAARMDPQHRLLLTCAREAVDDAGLSRRALAGSRTGVWVAMGSQDWLWRTAVRAGHVDAYSVLGVAAGQAAGRIAAHLDLRGPAVVVDAGCAAALVAVDAAARAVASGELDRAIVGAVQVVLAPEGGRMLAAMGVESDGEPPLPFDPDSPGSVRGEGAGVLVIERDGRPARTRAWIRGSAVVQAGAALLGGVPSADVLADAARTALAEAGVAPTDLGWVEAHGTGAPAADAVEWAALRSVYPDAPIGSAKAVVGHLEAAAGFVGLLSALGRATPERPLVAVGTFGMSGTVGHLVLEAASTRRGVLSEGVFLGRGSAPQRPARGGEAPPGPPGGTSELETFRPTRGAHPAEDATPHLVGLSAATPTALATAIERWSAALSAEDADVAGLCRAAARRDTWPWRVAVAGRTAEELVTGLRRPRAAAAPVARPPTVGFLFTGQGAQEPGMGRGLYAADPAFRAAFDLAAAAFAPLGVDVAALCFDGGDLRDTRLAQPALFALQWALAATWAARGLRPSVVVGHSIGELAAAAVAGALTLPDAARIVAARAAAMGALPPGGSMLAVVAPREDVHPFLDGLPLDVAVENGPRQVVVAGPDDAIAALEERLEDAFVPFTRLRTSHAFHSRLQDPCVPGFVAAIEGIPSAQPRVPWVSTARAALVDAAPAPAYWAAQLRGTVRFRQAMLAASADVWVEIGPGDTLCKHARSVGAQALPSLPRGVAEPDGLAAAVVALFERGADVLPDDGGPAAPAPPYPFEPRRFGPEGLVPDGPGGAVAARGSPTPAHVAGGGDEGAEPVGPPTGPAPAARAAGGPDDADPIVIVGLAARLPGAPDVEALARGVRAPFVAIGGPPPGRVGGVAGWLPDALRFDAAAFGVARREAARLDPRQGLALELAWEALERSGLAPDARATAVFVGVSGGEPRAVGEEVDPQALTGRVDAAIAGRVAYALGLEGPTMGVDAACASSLVAIHLAAASVRRGECEQALAGGVQVLGTPHGTALVAATGALSPTGRARPFDADADGFVRGEGGAFVVLTRRSRARALGLSVWGVLVGSATGHGGGGGGFTAPDPAAQERVMRAALGGVDPRGVVYVEAHGTGTRLGDPIEAAALGRVYGGVAVGSAKASFGHLEPAAGVVGLARLLIAMRAGRLPAQPSVTRLHPEVAAWGHRVPTGHEPWPAGGLGAVSAIGLTGTVAHVVVGPDDGVGVNDQFLTPPALTPPARTPPATAGVNDQFLTPPARTPPATVGVNDQFLTPSRRQPPATPPRDGGRRAARARPERTRWRVELSARTPGALRSLCDRWAAALEGRAELDVADVAWTALRRRRLPARRAVVAATVDELRAGLLAEGDSPGGVLPDGTGRRVIDLPIPAWGGEAWTAGAAHAGTTHGAASPAAPAGRAPATLDALLAELLPAALEAPDVPLGDLGLDSLGALVLAAAVPEVPATALRSFPLQALRARIGPPPRAANGALATTAPEARPTPTTEPPRPSLALPDLRLERLRDGRGLPLVLVHPGGVPAEGWDALDLGDRPVWLARSWALEAGDGASIAPWGVALAAAVGAVFSGPVALAGWSLGGVIAWEAAARVEAARGEAPLVVLLDTYGPGVTMPANLEPLARAWAAVAWPGDPSPRFDLWRQGLAASARRVAGWSPPPRRGDTLRVCASRRHGVPVGWSEGREAWVDADHYSLVRGDALAEVGRILRAELAHLEGRNDAN